MNDDVVDVRIRHLGRNTPAPFSTAHASSGVAALEVRQRGIERAIVEQLPGLADEQHLRAPDRPATPSATHAATAAVIFLFTATLR